MDRVNALVFVALVATTLEGCAVVAVDSRASREEVFRTVSERAGRDVRATMLDADDQAADGHVRGWLADGLTENRAVEIALVRNHELRALYTELDVAQTDVVQASLLHNPVGDAVAAFPVAGGAVDVSFGVAVDVIDLLYVPLRNRIATARLDEAKLRVAGSVLELAWRTEIAYFEHQANLQRLELRRQVADSAAASFELALRLRQAGNATELAVASERAFAESARLDVRSAELAVEESAERLNVLMGLWGEDAAAWKLAAERLPDPAEEEIDVERVESRAVERSLDLGAAERLVVAAGGALGLDRAAALFPELVAGGKGERRDARWEAGPTVTLPIPFFDYGQARAARARAELERARELYHSLGVRVRSAARSARERVIAHRERAIHYRRVLLPVEGEIVRQTRLQYDAMQLGPTDLLRAKEHEISTAERYVEALRDYWAARADLALVLAGRLPPGEQAPAPPALEQLPRFPFPALQ
jgi:cobalt-zinc-cadmium efflux system outer membrane protein